MVNHHHHQLPLQVEAVTILSNLIKSKPPPTDLNITILFTDECNDDGNNNPSQSSSYPYQAFVKDGPHLGINATDLPYLARDFKKDYFSLRPWMSMMMMSSSFLDRHPLSSEDQKVSAPPPPPPPPPTEQSTEQPTATATEPTISISTSISTLGNRIMDATTCLLLLCPDHPTAWADRRRLILHRQREEEMNGNTDRNDDDDNNDDNIHSAHSLLQMELQFLNLLFTQHSKAPSSWAHRKWILQQLMNSFRVSPPIKIKGNHIHNTLQNSNSIWKNTSLLISQEIQTCISVAESYPKNYYAWTHRFFCLQLFLNQWNHNHNHNTGNDNDNDTEKREIGLSILHDLFQKEIDSIQPWLKLHVSDHSCSHYGSQVLHLWLIFGVSKGGYCDSKGLNPLQWSLDKLLNALRVCRELLEVPTYSTHEAVWRYRRLCSFLAIQLVSRKLELFSNLIDYSSHMSSEVYHSLDQFLQKEVHDLCHRLSLSSSSNNDNPLSKEEQRLVQIHSKSYLMWICFHIKNLWSGDGNHGLLKYVSSNHLRIIWKELKEDTSIVHNFWREVAQTSVQF